MGLDESDVIGADDFMGTAMVAPVGFRVCAVPYEDAFNRSLIDLWVVRILNKHKSATADFAKVREVRLSPVPCFEWCHAT